MASPIITPFSAKTETEYRPVSRIAIVGLILSCFSLFLFVSDNGFLWMIFFVIPGLILSILARRAISQSEGNLAGEPIAILGIIISVCCGLGWMTSSLVRQYVTDVEARTAVDNWISQMQHNEPGLAFLYTQPASQRQLDFNPEEHQRLRLRFPSQSGKGSMYDGFVIHPIYSLLLRYGDKAKLTYVSLLESSYTRGSHSFRLKYLLDSPIATGEVSFLARSEDVNTDQGVRRQWTMTTENVMTNPLTPTKYGEELSAMVLRSSDEIKKFILAIANDELDKAKQMLAANPGDFQVVLGYLRPNHVKGPVLMEVQMPLRLISEKKEGNTWNLEFECSANVMPDRVVDFTLTASADASHGSKWNIGNLKFLGTHKRVTKLPQMEAMEGGPGQPPGKASAPNFAQ